MEGNPRIPPRPVAGDGGSTSTGGNETGATMRAAEDSGFRCHRPIIRRSQERHRRESLRRR